MKIQKLNKRRYLGVLCARKHDFNNTGKSVRYERCRTCCVCNTLSVKKYKNRYDKYREDNKDKMKKYQVTYNRDFPNKDKKAES